MRLLSYISAAIVVFIFVFSCINNKKTSAAKDKIENVELRVANIVGMYSGDLPCVDCDAINTVLEVNRNHSYVLTYMYKGKSDDQFVKEGSWSVDKNKLVLNGLDYQYKIDAESLVQLDLSGNEITGDLAKNYELLKVK